MRMAFFQQWYGKLHSLNCDDKNNQKYRNKCIWQTENFFFPWAKKQTRQNTGIAVWTALRCMTGLRLSRVCHIIKHLSVTELLAIAVRNFEKNGRYNSTCNAMLCIHFNDKYDKRKNKWKFKMRSMHIAHTYTTKMPNAIYEMRSGWELSLSLSLCVRINILSTWKDLRCLAMKWRGNLACILVWNKSEWVFRFRCAREGEEQMVYFQHPTERHTHRKRERELRT